MHILILVLALMATSTAYSETAAEAFCRSGKETAKEVAPQLPMAIDAATTWVSVAAVYAGGVCQVTHLYALDSEVLVDQVWNHLKKNNDVSREEVVEYYASGEALEKVKEETVQQIHRRLPGLSEIPNIVFTADYTSEGPLESFTVVIRTGDQ